MPLKITLKLSGETMSVVYYLTHIGYTMVNTKEELKSNQRSLYQIIIQKYSVETDWGLFLPRL